MTKKWTTVQNIIGFLLQAWGLYFIYSLSDKIALRLQQNATIGLIKSPALQDNLGSLFKLYHINYFSAALAFCGGFALIYNKKWGWVTSAASCLIFMGFMLVSGRDGLLTQADTKNNGYGISYLFAGLVFAVMFTLLMLKPLRVKFKANLVSWLFMGGLALLVLIDRQVF